jgi:hypothetical protein
MRRGTPRRSEENQSLDEEIGKIPEQLPALSMQSLDNGTLEQIKPSIKGLRKRTGAAELYNCSI